VSPWIISRRQDLAWLHGSALAGVALLAFFALVPAAAAAPAHAQPALLAVVLWGVLFDGTHVMGTYARTYFAPDEPSRASLPGGWSWALLAVGPALAPWDAAFRVFLMGAYLWAYYHLVKQHWGFVALYRRRDAERAGPEWLDRGLLWTVTLHPYVRYALGPSYAASGLPVLLPPETALALVPLVDALALAIALALLWGVARRVRRGALRPGPQHLLIAIVGTFHAAVFALLGDPLLITATLTIFHNLQYHRIVWHYEAGQRRRPLGGLWRYLAAGVAFGACWYGARVVGSLWAGPTTVGRALLGLGWGVALHHYLVDGRIWRVRRSPEVGMALDVATTSRLPRLAAGGAQG
jgi:hypothetical protein